MQFARSCARPLVLEDGATLRRHLAASGASLSEHSFANLFLFRHVHDYRLIEGDWPAISGRTYDGALHIMPLFDLASAPQAVQRNLLTEHECVYPVSDALTARIWQSVQPLSWAQSHVDADSDYLYRTAALADFRGTRLRKKLNQTRQFERNWGPSFEPLDASNIGLARWVLGEWASDVGKAAETADLGPCSEALDHFAALELIGFVALTRTGDPAGFVLAAQINAGTAVVHFAKGSRRYVGIFPFLFNRLARALGNRFQFLNFEQDLGNPRLAQNKRSYQPERLLHKYRLRLS